MTQVDLHALKELRGIKIAERKRVWIRRRNPEKSALRMRMDESLMPFRVARNAASTPGMRVEGRSWLRAIRQAVGIPVDVLAHRQGVAKREVLRQERAEAQSRIMVETLRRAAEALGCELVYALVPRRGSLDDLGACRG